MHAECKLIIAMIYIDYTVLNHYMEAIDYNYTHLLTGNAASTLEHNCSTTCSPCSASQSVA